MSFEFVSFCKILDLSESLYCNTLPTLKSQKYKLNPNVCYLSSQSSLASIIYLFYTIFIQINPNLKGIFNIIISMKYFILAILVAFVVAQNVALISAAPGQDKIVNSCANPDYECLKSAGGAYYDTVNCRCECNSIWKCRSHLHTWSNYPTCQCVCKKIEKCTELQYWDSKTCTCQCKYHIICFNPAYVQDPKTCQCVCKPVKCKHGQYQDGSCKCVPRCKQVQKCCHGTKFNYETCKCE